MPKNKKKSFDLQKHSKLLIIILISVLVGIVGSELIRKSFAAGYGNSPYINPYFYDASKMGDEIKFIPFYKKVTKTPIGKISCWKTDTNDVTSFSRNYDAIKNTTPIFQISRSLPPSGTAFYVVVGDAGTGPAGCVTELFNGEKWVSSVYSSVN